MSWMPTVSYNHSYLIMGTPFVRDKNKMIYCTSYHYEEREKQGIFEYDTKTNTRKTVKLWQKMGYFPSAASFIYNATRDTIIFVGGYNSQNRISICGATIHYYSIMIYSMKYNTVKHIDINTKMGNSPLLELTNNDTCLHIITKTTDNQHIMYDLSTNKANNIHTFNNTVFHGLIYTKITNQLIMFGALNQKDSAGVQDCYIFDLKNVNNVWKKENNSPIRLSMRLWGFGYVLYDNRIIITFGGATENYHSIDRIYYIDLLRNDKWKESKLKCPGKGIEPCSLIIDDGIIHIMKQRQMVHEKDHFYINISEILPSNLLKENNITNDNINYDNDDIKYNEWKCENCTFINEHEGNQCTVCSSLRSDVGKQNNLQTSKSPSVDNKLQNELLAFKTKSNEQEIRINELEKQLIETKQFNVVYKEQIEEEIRKSNELQNQLLEKISVITELEQSNLGQKNQLKEINEANLRERTTIKSLQKEIEKYKKKLDDIMLQKQEEEKNNALLNENDKLKRGARGELKDDLKDLETELIEFSNNYNNDKVLSIYNNSAD
eukprot:250083_1